MTATPTTSKLVNLAGLIRTVTKDLATQNTTQSSDTTTTTLVTPAQINSVFKHIGNFVNSSFKKSVRDHYNIPSKHDLIADIAQFGTIFKPQGSNTSEFIPSTLL